MKAIPSTGCLTHSNDSTRARSGFVPVSLILLLALAVPVGAQTDDFGDAPDPSYPTLMASGGAQHTIVPGMSLGMVVDPEPDGQPTPTASGDDVANLADEDGVVFTTQLVTGQSAQVQVVASAAGFLNAWVDFGADGSWAQLSDQIFSGVALVAGTNLVSFAVPPTAAVGVHTFARFRFSSVAALPYTGAAPDGEVEDYPVVILAPQMTVDFGDARDLPYPTLYSRYGAGHVIVPTMFMGSQIDAEADGQPDPAARGDDNVNLADEDGVVFVTRLVQGQQAKVVVTVSQLGFLNAWIDFQRDGSWAQPGDQIFFNQVVGPGANVLTFGVPIWASMGWTYARFRYNSTGNLTYRFMAADGEVEDYYVSIEDELQPTDFGDAPDPTYPTLFANNGAFHYVSRTAPVVQLGSLIDAETNGQPNVTATGDDISGAADEDGVTFLTTLTPGQMATVQVLASTNGNLSAWIDFGGDGSWAQASDNIFSGQPLATGTNVLVFFVPATAVGGNTYGRFRFTTAGALTYTAPAPDGEVEDYQVKIQPAAQTLDFGDAPDPTYPTLLASNGARHIIGPGLFMGTLIDGEPNGQPNVSANGDDFNNLADEDGVVFNPPLLNPGQVSLVSVTVVGPGLLNAWVDFGADGSWAQPGDQIFTNLALTTGAYSLSFMVSSNAAWGMNTFARFRYSTVPNLSYSGLAPDGEVEDQVVSIHALPYSDLGDAPDSNNSAGASMTAYPTGTNGNFPTVYGANPPFGPVHFNPVTNIAFLGNRVSGEMQADIGPDQDFINNILPLLNLPDLDGADDGLATNLPVMLPHCGKGQIPVQLSILSSTPIMFFNLWCDWNRDGDWNDIMTCPDGSTAAEHAVTNWPVPPPGGLYFITVNSWHPSLQIDPLWIRMSLAEQNWPPPGAGVAGGDGPSAGYQFGETEDYYLTNYLLNDTYDWGDAPDPTYPTLRASGGARHLIVAGFLLGTLEDVDLDGQPNAAATGDDSAGLADEDGVQLLGQVLLNSNALVQVNLTSGLVGGRLDAWLDFNGNGSWADSGEQVFSSLAIPQGLSTNSFSVPGTAKLGTNFARFRLSSAGGLSPGGLAMDGEVEDYLVTIRQPRPSTAITITNITATGITVGTNAGQVVQVQWTSESNIRYQLQAVTNLIGASTNWINVGSEVVGPANSQSETNVPSQTQRYYRVVAPFTWP
jgi:hypothetical protein